jgi:hypothetical protein
LRQCPLEKLAVAAAPAVQLSGGIEAYFTASKKIHKIFLPRTCQLRIVSLYDMALEFAWLLLWIWFVGAI